MLWDFFIDMFNSISTWAVGLLPDLQINLNAGAYMATMADFFGYIDTFISLDVIVLCIVTVLIVENWALVVRIVLKVWDLLPFT